MKKPRDSHLGFRMDKETHDKLFYIAEYEGRTGSGQILYLIRRCITEFEQVHGKINLEEELRALRRPRPGRGSFRRRA